jgi:hypothetical protein
MKTDLIDLELGDLPQDGPSMVVVAADAASTPVGRYRQAGRSGDALPSGKPLVALVRSGVLSTPDTIQAAESSSDGNMFRLTLDLRRYIGPISANVERETLVQAELGALSPGHYTVVITRTTREFQNLQQPEQAANPTSVEERLEFDVR